MCLICVEFQKLTIEEAKRNLGEMAAGLGDHASVVEEKIKEKEFSDTVKGLVEKWKATGLLNGLEGLSIAELARLLPR